MNEIEQTIGRRVRQLRQSARLTLRDLARRSGVSAAMISEVERGAKSPTITLLSAVAAALGVSMARLVQADSPPKAITVMRGIDHRRISIGQGAEAKYLAPHVEASKVTFVYGEMQHGAESDLISSHGAGSIERTYVVHGSLELTVGSETAVIDAGDSCTYAGDRPHRLANVGDGVVAWFNVIERM
ncbi:MAG TPA: XRE family transcriptional regulator [Candidatus Baltobacteraceae bacterium]